MKILVFLLVVGILVYAIAQAPLPAPLPPVSGSVPKITKEERFQANIIAVRRIKAATKNPDSFTLEYVMDTDDALCVTYRTTNALNEAVPGRAVVYDGEIVSSEIDGNRLGGRWNDRCARKAGANVAHIRDAL